MIIDLEKEMNAYNNFIDRLIEKIKSYIQGLTNSEIKVDGDEICDEDYINKDYIIDQIFFNRKASSFECFVNNKDLNLQGYYSIFETEYNPENSFVLNNFTRISIPKEMLKALKEDETYLNILSVEVNIKQEFVNLMEDNLIINVKLNPPTNISYMNQL